MADMLNGQKRDIMCGLVNESMIGQTVTVMGWTSKRRDFGSLIFVDLRDKTGIVQVVFDSSLTKDFEKAEKIRNEYVLAIEGKIRKRSEDTINEKIATGTVEIEAKTLKILAEAETTPFAIEENTKVNEVVRLKYRYLDLRRPDLQKNLIMRNKISKIARDYLDENGFMEIETPFLGKSTPEGARDYLVPSRIHKGCFYALPQSPQLFKQLLMISGFDRYYQVARCFRDEDLRANRQPEFTQIDLEMSFVDKEESVMSLNEGLIQREFKECLGLDIPTPFKRLKYEEAMNRFGSDKPDTRFGLEITDISDIAEKCDFKVFSDAVKKGGSVRMINAKGFWRKILSRRDVDALTDFVKTYKAKGLAWIAMDEVDGVKSVITKFLSQDQTDEILRRANAETGDIIFFAADTNDIVFATLGALRLHLGEMGNLIDKSKFDILWVTDFPLFEYDQTEKRYVACHHPFTSPKDEDLDLFETDPSKMHAKAYDLVINGEEAGGGSIRIYNNEIQERMFKTLGFSEQDIKDRFGFFVDAFKYGTPPHGGLAFGLDRLTMLFTGAESIKDVIAFPKVQNASCLMTEAPSTVEEKQLTDLSIKVDEDDED